jgi:hypothetical protein
MFETQLFYRSNENLNNFDSTFDSDHKKSKLLNNRLIINRRRINRLTLRKKNVQMRIYIQKYLHDDKLIKSKQNDEYTKSHDLLRFAYLKHLMFEILRQLFKIKISRCLLQRKQHTFTNV